MFEDSRCDDKTGEHHQRFRDWQRGALNLTDDEILECLAKIGVDDPEFIQKHMDSNIELTRQLQHENAMVRQVFSLNKLGILGTNYKFVVEDLSDEEEFQQICKADKKSLQPTVEINGQTYVRRLSVEEIMRIYVIDFNRLRNSNGCKRSMAERTMLFEHDFITCSAFARKPRTRVKFKFVPVCEQLVTGESINYNGLDGPELHKDKLKLEDFSCKRTILENEFWVLASGEDIGLLSEFYDIVLKYNSDGIFMYNSGLMRIPALFDSPRSSSKILPIQLWSISENASCVGLDGQGGLSYDLRVTQA